MNDVTQLLADQQAANRAEAARKQQAQVPSGPDYRYVGKNADTGQPAVTADSEPIAAKQIITNGQIQPGQAIKLLAGFVDQMPAIKPVPEPEPAAESRVYPYWVGFSTPDFINNPTPTKMGALFFKSSDESAVDWEAAEEYPSYSGVPAYVAANPGLFGQYAVTDFYAGSSRWWVAGEGRPDGQVPICYSDDQGVTWEAIDLDPDPKAADNPISEMGNNANLVLDVVDNDNGQVVVNVLSGFYVSSDNGESWEFVYLPVETSNTYNRRVYWYNQSWWLLEEILIASNEFTGTKIRVHQSDDGLEWRFKDRIEVSNESLQSAQPLIGRQTFSGGAQQLLLGTQPSYEALLDAYNPEGEPPEYLPVFPNGDLQIFSSSHRAIWASYSTQVLFVQQITGSEVDQAQPSTGRAAYFDGEFWNEIDHPLKGSAAPFVPSLIIYQPTLNQWLIQFSEKGWVLRDGSSFDGDELFYPETGIETAKGLAVLPRNLFAFELGMKRNYGVVN